ncbi:Peroxiredoxin 1 [Coemansia sp. RSA 552]|nr:Peroxiredoxin 1 [Coemansia sp. RSA 552]
MPSSQPTKRPADNSVSREQEENKKARLDQPTQEVPCTPTRCVIGQRAPDFACPALLSDDTLGTVQLSSFAGQYVALVFYPADFTFVCPTEITELADRLAEFRALDCELLLCSTDSEYVHYNWRQQPRREGGIEGTQVTMLADRAQRVARAFGVLDQDSGLAFRATVLIDRTQQVRVKLVNDMPVGRSADEVLRLVAALKHTDEHGEVCPENWKPGDKTIVPEVSKSKEYFTST